MSRNLATLGPRLLTKIVMPGSHDAGMSKIDGGDNVSKPGSFTNSKEVPSGNASAKRAAGSKDSMDQATERISNVKLETSPFGEKVQPGKAKAPGPSLLSQQAPAQPLASSSSHQQPSPPPYEEDEDAPAPVQAGPTPPVSSSAMSVDGNMPLLDGTEKITVKIADLGNGQSLVLG